MRVLSFSRGRFCVLDPQKEQLQANAAITAKAIEDLKGMIATVANTMKQTQAGSSGAHGAGLMDDAGDTNNHPHVRIVAVHLEGKALQWHQIFMKNRLTTEMPQCGKYEYLDRLDELMNCVELSEPYAISCFLGGLKSEIAINVRIFKPRTLQDAISVTEREITCCCGNYQQQTTEEVFAVSSTNCNDACEGYSSSKAGRKVTIAFGWPLRHHH
ncbi:hypothetical protein BUALT_Bualt01G0104600 [Buddleja alternifolia]|uniref:Retrotransposon gag domain-containing protein n=1 Tax=Buddleja alternifolia TaxID=168488 RepID=A0AAV6Y729_9LAMI|nr:hypothetical protein BUALT_Bualt01G0104600 [Buddleja alternifolia]